MNTIFEWLKLQRVRESWCQSSFGLILQVDGSVKYRNTQPWISISRQFWCFIRAESLCSAHVTSCRARLTLQAYTKQRN